MRNSLRFNGQRNHWKTTEIDENHKSMVTSKFFISRLQELKILIIISCQSSKNVNKQLECIDNNNINAEILEQKGLHFSRYFSRSAELVPPNKLGPPSLIGENLKKLRKLLLNHVKCIEIYMMTKNLDGSNFQNWNTEGGTK